MKRSFVLSSRQGPAGKDLIDEAQIKRGIWTIHFFLLRTDGKDCMFSK